MIIILIILFTLLPKYLKVQNERMKLERKYHETLKKAAEQNLDIEYVIKELGEALPSYFKNSNQAEIELKLNADINLLRSQL